MPRRAVLLAVARGLLVAGTVVVTVLIVHAVAGGGPDNLSAGPVVAIIVASTAVAVYVDWRRARQAKADPADPRH